MLIQFKPINLSAFFVVVVFNFVSTKKNVGLLYFVFIFFLAIYFLPVSGICCWSIWILTPDNLNK